MRGTVAPAVTGCRWSRHRHAAALAVDRDRGGTGGDVGDPQLDDGRGGPHKRAAEVGAGGGREHGRGGGGAERGPATADTGERVDEGVCVSWVGEVGRGLDVAKRGGGVEADEL